VVVVVVVVGRWVVEGEGEGGRQAERQAALEGK